MACFEEDKLVRTVSVVCTDLVNLVAWKGVWTACPSGGWCVTLAPWPLGLWCSLTADAVDWIKWPHGGSPHVCAAFSAGRAMCSVQLPPCGGRSGGGEGQWRVTTAALHGGWPVGSVRCAFRYFAECTVQTPVGTLGLSPARLGRSWVARHLAQQLRFRGDPPSGRRYWSPSSFTRHRVVSPVASLPVGIAMAGIARVGENLSCVSGLR